MSRMARIGAFRFRPACISGVLMLALFPSVRSEESPEEQQRKAFEDLGVEALANRRTIDQYGFPSTVSIFPIDRISKELGCQPGVISLIADPKDRRSGRIAVYLANATEKPLKGAVYELIDCFLEVKEGGRWRSCQPMIPGCGTVSPPGDLEAGHAKIFAALDPAIGDMEGELRYCVRLPYSRPVASKSFRGRFSSKQFDEAELGSWGGMAAAGIEQGLNGKGWSDPKLEDHPLGSVARCEEEWLAAAELDGSYDESARTRTQLVRWKATAAPDNRCHEPLAVMLGKPWNKNLDTAALFSRCRQALKAAPEARNAYGSPERRRAVVWRYLSWSGMGSVEFFINPERWDQLEFIRQSGNPWGVEPEFVREIVAEAVASLDSADEAERIAVGNFLQGGWISEDALSDDGLRGILSYDLPCTRLAGLMALSRRGKREEAGQWLANHGELPVWELRSLWTRLAEYKGDVAVWEIPVAIRLLEISPLEGADQLMSRCHQLRDPARKPLPIALKEPLVRFLAQEAEEKKLVGRPIPTREDPWGSRGGVWRPEDGAAEYLSAGLLVLAAWGDPNDTPLILKFLEHPAAYYSESNRGIVREFGVRQTAVRLLKARGVQIPPDVIIDEVVK